MQSMRAFSSPIALQEFRDAGYVTQYGEDAGQVGTFTYRLKGFDKQPTDHYSRTMFVVSCRSLCLL